MVYHLVFEKMQTDKYLITVTDLKILDSSKVQNCTFLFPLQKFCCGYPLTFKLEDVIASNSYLLINRILTDNDLKKLKEILKNLNTNIKGIIFRDLGVLNIINELELNVKKVYYLAHNGLNYESINEYLNYVDSVVISTDLTKEEIEQILQKLHKKAILYTFGLIEIMYSRRNLLSNFNHYYNLEEKLVSNVQEPITKKGFKVVENEYGTIFYNDKYYYNANFFKNDNVLFYWLNPLFLSSEKILNIYENLVSGKIDLSNLDIEIDSVFLKQKSISKLKSDIDE